MKWTRKHAIVAGAALIAATNAVALLGVAYNRRGEPESTLRLSQRELVVWGAREGTENSGLALRLRARVLDEDIKDPASYRWAGRGFYGSPRWLDRDKMAALGFDVTAPDNPENSRRGFGRQLSRGVLLVLENDGPTYQRALANATAAAEAVVAGNMKDAAKIAAEIVDYERDGSSRLFAVDAGLDAAMLRAKYPDRSRYAIVGGRIAPSGGRAIARTHAGEIHSVDVQEINVPIELRPAFEGVIPESRYSSGAVNKAAYDATVSFGGRLEPWLVSTSSARGKTPTGKAP